MATDTPATASDTYKNQIRDIGPFIDARQYGIVSDPVKDQTAEFQAMSDDLTAGNSGARTVVLPAGDFHITSSVDFNQFAPVELFPNAVGTNSASGGFTLMGQGKYATRIFMDTAGESAFRVYSPAGSVQVESTSFSGFGLYGPGLTDKDSCGIQLGGVTVASTDIIARIRLQDIRITDFSSAMRLDDVTALYMEHCKLEGYLYGIEFGFNVDILTAVQTSFGTSVVPSVLTATTDGSTAVVTSVVTTLLRAGMRIVSTAFPQGTIISTIDSGTQFTASANSTGVVANLDFVLGTALSYGDATGNWAGEHNTTPGNASAHNFLSCLYLQNAEIINVMANTTTNIKFDTCYMENNNRIATLDMNATTGSRYIIFDSCHISRTDSFQDYAIYENLNIGGSGTIVIRNCRSDSAPAVPWVRLESANSRLDWDNNELSSSSGDVINVFDSNTGYSPSSGYKFSIGCGGTNMQAEVLGVTGSLTPRPAPASNNTIRIGAMTGNVTVNNVSGGVVNATVVGQALKFIFEQDGTGSRTVVWGTQYFGTDGLHLEVGNDWTESTAADEFCIIEFMWDGSQWLQTTASNYWV